MKGYIDGHYKKGRYNSRCHIVSHGLASINELRERVLEEARKKAKEIIEDAKEKAHKIIEAAEIEWRNRFNETKKKIIEEYNRRFSTIVSEAKIRHTLIISKAKNDVIETVFNKAVEELKKRNYDVRKSLEKLLEEAIMYLPKETKHITIIVNPKDKPLISDIAQAILGNKLNYEIKTSNSIIGGLVIETPEEIKIDNSYETRLSRAREVLVNKIAEILWQNDG